jgi:hypothetical protein
MLFEPKALFVSLQIKMYPSTKGVGSQRGRRPAKLLRAGELTGSSWIKLHFIFLYHFLKLKVWGYRKAMNIA